MKFCLYFILLYPYIGTQGEKTTANVATKKDTDVLGNLRLRMSKKDVENNIVTNNTAWEVEMREALINIDVELEKYRSSPDYEDDIDFSAIDFEDFEETKNREDEDNFLRQNKLCSCCDYKFTSNGWMSLSIERVDCDCEDYKKKKKGSRKRKGKPKGKRLRQYKWASKVAKKIGAAEAAGACTPAYIGREFGGLATLWNGCDGWDQITLDCWRPCSHYKGGYSMGIWGYCFKPCNAENQLDLNVGCGLAPGERTCHVSSGDCAMKYVNHAISIADVLSTFLTGGVAGAVKAAAKTAFKAASKVALKHGLKMAVKEAAKEFGKKLMKNKVVQKKLQKYKKEVKDEIMEQGSELFIAASMGSDAEPDVAAIADEIAETLDPTGIYSLVKGFIPPEDCDSMVVMNEEVPGEDEDCPDAEAMDMIDDDDDCGTMAVKQDDYRGKISWTEGEYECQRWDVQYPHEHSFTAAEYPSSGLAENYCRNPGRDGTKAWCYTTDPNKRWQYCDVPTCA